MSKETVFQASAGAALKYAVASPGPTGATPGPAVATPGPAGSGPVPAGAAHTNRKI